MSVAFFVGRELEYREDLARRKEGQVNNSSPPPPPLCRAVRSCRTAAAPSAASDLTAPLAVCGVDGLLTPATPENS